MTDLNADAAKAGSILTQKETLKLGLQSVMSRNDLPSMKKYKLCNASHIIQVVHYLSHAAALAFPSSALCLIETGYWAQ